MVLKLKMCKLKVIRNLLAVAKKCDKEKKWNLAVISYKELVNLCRHTVNDISTSNQIKETLMDLAMESIERCERIENLIIFKAESLKVKKERAQRGQPQINVTEKLKTYFASEQGKRHNPEQIKCIQNIAMLVSVTKPNVTLDDVFGLEGKLQ